MKCRNLQSQSIQMKQLSGEKYFKRSKNHRRSKGSIKTLVLSVHMMNCNLSMSVVCMINSTSQKQEMDFLANNSNLTDGKGENSTWNVTLPRKKGSAPLVNWTPEEEVLHSFIQLFMNLLILEYLLKTYESDYHTKIRNRHVLFYLF